MDYVQVLQQVFNTASIIFILVLVASGLAIIFGMMKIINLAHGEFFLLGAYFVYLLSAEHSYGIINIGLNIYLAIVVSTCLCAALGYLLDRCIMNRLYHRLLDAVLATWALSILIREGIKLTLGAAPRPIQNPLPGYFTLFDVAMPKWRLFVMLATAIVLLAIYLLFQRTTFGLRSRAAIANKDMAAALGTDIKRIYSQTFMIGTALAGLAGALIGPMVAPYPELGIGYLVKSFFVVIVGGIGRLTNVIGGGVVIGGSSGLFWFVLSPVFAEVLVFTLAVVIIRFKPTGLFGSAKR